MEETGRLQSMGLRRVGYDWVTSLSLFTFMHWRRKWKPIPIFLPGKFHGQRSLVGYSPQGCKRVRDNSATKQQQQSELQSWPTLCDPVDCSSPGSSIYGIFQARILERVAIYYFREASRPRDRTRVSRAPASTNLSPAAPLGKPNTRHSFGLRKEWQFQGNFEGYIHFLQ